MPIEQREGARRAVAPGVVLWLMLGCVSLAQAAESNLVFLQEAPPVVQKNPPAIQFWKETRTEPRPVAIYALKVDLQNPRVEVAAAIAPDPDGEGLATSQLIPPLKLAESRHLTVAVNANAFSSLPDAAGRKSTDWFDGMMVNIMGGAINTGRTVNPPKHGYACFWIGSDSKAHIGDPKATDSIREAVAGFEQLMRGGTILCITNGPLHPRTSVGLDSSARFMCLVAVDGRQAGYSEGMTTYELATFMKALGCSDAINLDGGGSTVLMVKDESGQLQILNRPSGRGTFGGLATRPVPVLLGVRLRE
jgi:hypothetical protein